MGRDAGAGEIVILRARGDVLWSLDTLVMALLLAVSLASWTAIFRKWFAIRNAHAATVDFEDRFWGGVDLSTLYEQVSEDPRGTGRHARAVVERVFYG